MIDRPPPAWLNEATFDATLLRTDPLLVRLNGPGSRELANFLEDLIAWNAGLRDYATAAREYIRSGAFGRAARCVLQMGVSGRNNTRLAEEILHAWDGWEGVLTDRLKTGAEAEARFRKAGCGAALTSELEGTLKSLRQKARQIDGVIRNRSIDGVVRNRSREESLKCIAELEEQTINEIGDELVYLQLGCEECEKDLVHTNSLQDRQIDAIRQQTAKAVATMLSEANLDTERRARALDLLVTITTYLDVHNIALAERALADLGELSGTPLGELPSLELRSEEIDGVNRVWNLSERTKREIQPTPGRGAATEFPEHLEDPPGWEWAAQKLGEIRVASQALASSPDSPYKNRALGPFLAVRAKQRLLSDDPDQALVFFREAYAWTIHSSPMLRAPVRWRKDCAWGVLLSVLLAFRPANDARLTDRTQLLSPQNLETLFQREIGLLPLAIIEEDRLLPDLAHHILQMDTHSAEVFVREHMWEYLSERVIGLHEFAAGLAMELPEEADKVLATMAVLLESSPEAADKQAAPKLRSLVAKTRKVVGNERELRYILDEARQALRTAADESDLAEALADGIDARSRSSMGGSIRAAVSMVTDLKGNSSPERLLLRVSYVAGDDVLRGVQITPQLETSQGQQIKDALDTSVTLGRLLPREVREVAIRFRPNVDLTPASYVAINLTRRDTDGISHNIDLRGNRLRFPALNPPRTGDLPRNPYLVGKAIMDAEQIFGRDDEINDIVRSLMGEAQDNVVLVLGERRIGKTTVLNGLRHHREIRQRYLVTYTDMESAGDFQDSAVFYKSYLIHPVRDCLRQAGLPVEELDHEFLSGSPHRAFENFMSKVDQTLKARRRRVLVILDELEKVFEEVERRPESQNGGLPEEVVAALRSVIINTSQISFVLAGITDVVRRHLLTAKARLFNLTLEVPLTTLPSAAVSRLISDVPKGAYTVRPSAVNRIIEETNRHPYLVQKVCHELFEYMVGSNEAIATEADVEHIFDTRVLRQGQPFAYLVETIRRPEDMAVIDALAFVQSGARYVSVRDLQTQLLRTGIESDEGSLKEHLDQLRDQAPSVLERAPNNANQYRIAIQLFARHRRIRQLTQHNLVLRPLAAGDC